MEYERFKLEEDTSVAHSQWKFVPSERGDYLANADDVLDYIFKIEKESHHHALEVKRLHKEVDRLQMEVLIAETENNKLK